MIDNSGFSSVISVSLFVLKIDLSIFIKYMIRIDYIIYEKVWVFMHEKWCFIYEKYIKCIKTKFFIYKNEYL